MAWIKPNKKIPAIERAVKSKSRIGKISILTSNVINFAIFWLSIFIYKEITVPNIKVALQREAIKIDFLFNSKSINVLSIPTVRPSKNVEAFNLFLLTTKLYNFTLICKLFYPKNTYK